MQSPRTYLLLLLLLLTCQYSYGQTTAKLMHRDGFRFYKEVMVNTQDSSIIAKDERIVIFKETSKYILFTSYALFQQNLKDFIKEYNISWDKELFSQFKQQDANVLFADKIAQKPLTKMRVDLRTSSLLQQGNCLVYNKQSKKLERSIVVKWYRSGKKCVTEGKIFYVHNNEILITQEL